VRLQDSRTDANGCSVKARKIASLESSREGFSSEKVVGELGEGNLVWSRNHVTGLKGAVSHPSVTIRSLSISVAAQPFLARCQTIDLWFIVFRILIGVPSHPIASKRESGSIHSRFADFWFQPSRFIQPLLPTDGGTCPNPWLNRDAHGWVGHPIPQTHSADHCCTGEFE
jgi:hypothetical protein